MRHVSAYRKRIDRAWWRRLVIVTFVALVLAHVLDRVAYHSLLMGSDVQDAKDRVEWRSWYQIARQSGGAMTWVLIAGVLALATISMRDLTQKFKELPLRILGAVVLGGVLAELGKVLIGRERPTDDGGYLFKPPLGALFDHSNLGIPSSHTTVAFAALGVIAWAYPRTGWVLLPLAAGCGLSRMVVGAHFLSDVVLGAAIGLAAARICRSEPDAPVP